MKSDLWKSPAIFQYGGLKKFYRNIKETPISGLLW